ncbi:DUF2141 domain-containing protein [Candidatus Omnitrophota bacterium]
MSIKKVAIILSVVFCVFSFAFADADSEKGTLELRIDGFGNNLGKARVALDNSEESYKSRKKAWRSAKEKIANRNCTVFFKGLPYGEYAIKVFHDKNDNKKLDTNFLGIPNEAFGFSNNARGTFGPPAFEKAKFLFSKKNRIHRITVK